MILPKNYSNNICYRIKKGLEYLRCHEIAATASTHVIRVSNWKSKLRCNMKARAKVSNQQMRPVG
jgi:hypothetical protein